MGYPLLCYELVREIFVLNWNTLNPMGVFPLLHGMYYLTPLKVPHTQRGKIPFTQLWKNMLYPLIHGVRYTLLNGVGYTLLLGGCTLPHEVEYSQTLLCEKKGTRPTSHTTGK